MGGDKITFKFDFLNVSSLLQIKTSYGPEFICKFHQDTYFQATISATSTKKE
jgi:hypothetical protein